MRPLRYSINVTLDGCVHHEAGSADEELHRRAREAVERADVLILGRVTYQMMEAAWRPPALDAMPAWTQPFGRTMDAARKLVVSSTLHDVDWNAELLRGDLETAVRELKEQPGEGLYTGGVQLPTALAGMGLIDEYELVVHPVVAGRGPYLFAGLPAALDLELARRDEHGPSGVVSHVWVPRTARTP